MPSLPSEIFDHIVDHLHYDQASLLACALASKDMLGVSRYHLFHDMGVGLYTSDLFPLLNILSNPSNCISPFVRRIVLANIPECLRSHGRTDIVRAIRLVPRLLHLLPHADSVRFCNSDLEFFPEDIALQLFSRFRRFRNLELVSIRFNRFSDFVRTVCGFVVLERVWFKWVAWTHFSPPSLPLKQSLPSARWHIYGTGNRCMDLFSWLGSHDSPPLVHSMLYEPETISERDHIDTFLKRCAPSLRHLQVAFPIFTRKDNFKELMENYIALTGCVSLRSLRFKQVLLWPGDTTSQTLQPWIARILNDIPSLHLKEIVLELHIAPSTHLEKSLQAFDWSAFRKALLRFRSLRSISIFVGPGVVDFQRVVNLICYSKLTAHTRMMRICNLDTGERFGYA